MAGSAGGGIESAARWGIPFTLREQILLALLAASVAVAKAMVRIPINVPGHSGLFWIAILVIGRGMVRKPGAGLLMGMIAGLLVTVTSPSKEGFLVWTKYAAPGLTLDILAPLMRERLDVPLNGMIAGALAHVAKLISGLVIALVLGIPATFVAIGLGVSATTHVVFGALGGLLGSLVLIQLRKANILGTGDSDIAGKGVA